MFMVPASFRAPMAGDACAWARGAAPRGDDLLRDPGRTFCVLRFLLDLSVRQAAEAVRCRIDAPYSLAMELDDPDFRERLTHGHRADRCPPPTRSPILGAVGWGWGTSGGHMKVGDAPELDITARFTLTLGECRRIAWLAAPRLYIRLMPRVAAFALTVSAVMYFSHTARSTLPALTYLGLAVFCLLPPAYVGFSVARINRRSDHPGLKPMIFTANATVVRVEFRSGVTHECRPEEVRVVGKSGALWYLRLGSSGFAAVPLRAVAPDQRDGLVAFIAALPRMQRTPR
jgi:hypothetical protein